MNWSWQQLHHEIPFNIVRKIILDLPQYDDSEVEDDEEIKEQTAEEFAAMMNNWTL